MASIDGICEECGNTGLVGEVCSFCGSKIVAVDKDLDKYETDPIVTPVRKNKAAESDLFDEDDADLDIDPDLDELEDLDAGEKGSGDEMSMEDLAEKEQKKEEKDSWFDADNFNIDEDEKHG